MLRTETKSRARALQILYAWELQGGPPVPAVATGLARLTGPEPRILDRAEALYLRAFELTDGAYQDTYFYNLQYLYGVEKPGHEERWWRLARKAAERILKETPEGGFVPDEGKREAARRDAEALRRLLEATGR